MCVCVFIDIHIFTLHCIALHCIALHYIAVHYIAYIHVVQVHNLQDIGCKAGKGEGVESLMLVMKVEVRGVSPNDCSSGLPEPSWPSHRLPGLWC